MLPTTQRLLRDCALVAVAGVGFGIVANAISPHGLSLTRDYFSSERAEGGTVTPLAATSAPDGRERSGGPADTERGGPPATSAPGSSADSYRRVEHADAVRLFEDPRRKDGRVLFVDARDDARFAAGHIPGAQPFDHYRPERHIQEILGATPLAETIVIYCNGGSCEDSRLVAGDLIALGVPTGKLAIYGGGFSEWRQKRMPVERGERAP